MVLELCVDVFVISSDVVNLFVTVSQDLVGDNMGGVHIIIITSAQQLSIR